MTRWDETRDRAARWILASEEPEWSSADQASLDLWLAEATMHRVAYLRLQQSWRQAGRLRALQDGRSIAVEPVSEDKAAKLFDTDRHRAHTRFRSRAFAWAPIAAAASLLIMIGAGLLALSWPGMRSAPVATAEFETAMGARRIVGLPDGSKVELNTASLVRTAVGKARREVWLDRGEAYFEVAHDRLHPFVIHAGGRQITVLGTKFSIRCDGDRVTVSVLEGRVRVDDVEDGRAIRSTIMNGGDVAMSRGSSTLVRTKSGEQIKNEFAWREGMLHFEQQALSDVLAEFNRYNARKLKVADPAVGTIRIGGMFPASKPRAFANLLRDAYGLKIEESGETIRISE